MFSKNLKYYRLKMDLSKKELARKCNLSPMAISNYEDGKRMPDMQTIERLAKALNVRISDFLTVQNQNLIFNHGEYRKASSLHKGRQEFIREAVERYFDRFFTAVEFVGGEVLPKAPKCHALSMSGDAEKDAVALRKHLGFASTGPIDGLIAFLENKGILIYSYPVSDEGFSGLNGLVNDHPYIVINANMTTERNRSTIAHELAHLFFKAPEGLSEKEIEKQATAISGAFLLPQNDLIRELGIRRYDVTKDMSLVCVEYGVSAYLLVKRAEIAKIISSTVARQFYFRAAKAGWQKNEPTRIAPETPTLFKQLVYRAVNEEEISIQRGAELLEVPFSEVAKCRGIELVEQ